MAWIKVFSEVWDSWKIPTLCGELKISEVQAIGHLVSLWTFTERNAWRTGDLKKWGAIGISKAGRWTGNPGDFINALQTAGFLNSETMKIHEWETHQAGMIHDRSRRLPGIPQGTGGDSAGQIRVDKRREGGTEDKKISKGGGRTINPTLAEVQEYCKTKGIPADPVKFWAHYQGVGWKIGAAPIKDWQAVLLKWTTPQVQAPQQTPAAPRAPKMAYDKPAETPIEDPRGWEPLK